jgi:uncharacterized protein YdeI (YjbR/CyaY-like superfamily)
MAAAFRDLVPEILTRFRRPLVVVAEAKGRIPCITQVNENLSRLFAIGLGHAYIRRGRRLVNSAGVVSWVGRTIMNAAFPKILLLVFACTSVGLQGGMKPTFFPTPTVFREWLEQNHAKADALWVGYYKKGSGKPSMTWPESVDEALCYGWIDGIRKSIDGVRYTIRFTPRKRGSVWSSVNIKRAQALIKQGHMQPSGLKAYQARRENKSGIYSYEQRRVDLEEPYNRLLKKNETAWSFFQTQTASYRRAISWWIISAKKEETRLLRLEKLIEYSVQGLRLPEFAPGKRAAKGGKRRTRR